MNGNFGGLGLASSMKCARDMCLKMIYFYQRDIQRHRQRFSKGGSPRSDPKRPGPWVKPMAQISFCCIFALVECLVNNRDNILLMRRMPVLVQRHHIPDEFSGWLRCWTKCYSLYDGSRSVITRRLNT